MELIFPLEQGRSVDKPKPSFSAHLTLSCSFFITEAIGD
jgi:hypothetical protein